MEFQNILIALGLTLFAGLSTGVGSALAFFARRTNTRLLSAALDFSSIRGSSHFTIYVAYVFLYPTRAIDRSFSYFMEIIACEKHFD